MTVSPGDFRLVGFGDPVTVTVAVPFDQVTWLPGAWFLGGANLWAQSVMGGERIE